MPVVYPCNLDNPRAPGLYTYYAITSLLVVVLAVSLIWLPILQLITELNTIIAKVVIYFNVQLLGSNDSRFFNALEAFFLSHTLLLVLCVSCICYALYLASGDFLLFAACFICNLPNINVLTGLKKRAIDVIEYLLNLRGKGRVIVVTDKETVQQIEPHP